MPEILHLLKIDAPAEAVYEAVTDRDGLASWWTRDTEGTGEVGLLTMFGFNDRETVFEMEVTKLEPGNRVEWRCLGGHHEWEGTDLFFGLEREGDRTVLRFGHTGWESTEGILPLCSYNWARYLSSLKSYVETGEGDPWPG
jgi:uncharacterized protein YndB with AHSA1/START domain